MTRRFWGGVMVVSLLTSAGAAAYMYKMVMDKSTATVPLKQVVLKPAAPPPVPHEAPKTETPKAEEKKLPLEKSADVDELRNIQFAYANSAAKTVFIIGTLTNGNKEALTKNGRKWTVNLKLRPGPYEYNYLVDGKTVKDPFNKKTANGKSIITVKTKAR